MVRKTRLIRQALEPRFYASLNIFNLDCLGHVIDIGFCRTDPGGGRSSLFHHHLAECGTAAPDICCKRAIA
jgi:hypothetical protein